ncbi:MAG: hypothetical protein IM638_01555 [Bacteroidetes bacterium]|nr:hypothetical protein [Bacteroidota bacterium]
MRERHFSFDVERITPLKMCGKVVMYEFKTSGGFEYPFEIQPTKGEHDFSTCEKCQKSLSDLTKRFTEKFNGNKQKKGFPLCCPYHSNLVNIKEFNRDFMVNVPAMVARKIIYTNQHIINYHSSENWYKQITDYIDYAVDSFGKMPKDCGEPLYLSDYFDYVTDLLKPNTVINSKKKEQIFDFINAYKQPAKSYKTDLQLLLNIYQKWLNEFPFELNSYFGNLKQYFENSLPLLNGTSEMNIYSGWARVKFHTKASLIMLIENITKDILNQINGVSLYEKGLITDTNKIQIELLISSRKLKLNAGYKSSSKDEEQRYRKILKEWLEDEKKFFKELAPLLSQSIAVNQNPKQETRAEKLSKIFAQHGFNELDKVKNLSEPNKIKLVELIAQNKIPYIVAMLDFLGFFTLLKKDYFGSDDKLYKSMSKWFDCDERAIKGNKAVLNEISKEDRKRYTADQQKETVKKDYEKLK